MTDPEAQAAGSPEVSAAPAHDDGAPAPAGAPGADLTPIELDVALLCLAEDGPTSVADLAARLDLHPTRLLAILARPHVGDWIAAARAVEQFRVDLLASRARAVAIETLTTVARDTECAPVERRRAASAILRALGTPPLRGGSSSTQAEHEGGALGTPPLRGGPSSRQGEHDANTPDSPRAESPDELFTTIARALSATGDTAALATIHAHCATPLRRNDLDAFCATPHAALLRAAAGARLVSSSDTFEHGPWRCRQCAFQPAGGAPVVLQFSLLDFGCATPNWRIGGIDLVASAEPDPEHTASGAPGHIAADPDPPQPSGEPTRPPAVSFSAGRPP